MNNALLTELRYVGGEATLHHLNDTAHLCAGGCRVTNVAQALVKRSGSVSCAFLEIHYHE